MLSRTWQGRAQVKLWFAWHISIILYFQIPPKVPKTPKVPKNEDFSRWFLEPFVTFFERISWFFRSFRSGTTRQIIKTMTQRGTLRDYYAVTLRFDHRTSTKRTETNILESKVSLSTGFLLWFLLRICTEENKSDTGGRGERFCGGIFVRGILWGDFVGGFCGGIFISNLYRENFVRVILPPSVWNASEKNINVSIGFSLHLSNLIYTTFYYTSPTCFNTLS